MDQISTEKSSLSETAVIETQRTRSETLPINIHLKRAHNNLGESLSQGETGRIYFMQE